MVNQQNNPWKYTSIVTTNKSPTLLTSLYVLSVFRPGCIEYQQYVEWILGGQQLNGEPIL